jgi:hypothetical protein
MKAKRFNRHSEPRGDKGTLEHEDDDEDEYDYCN